MDIDGVSVERLAGGATRVTVSATLPRGEGLEADDLASILQVMEEANGSLGSGDGSDVEPEPESKPRRRRKKAAEEPEAEEEPEEKPKRRRRKKAAEEEPEETEGTEEAEEEEEPEEKPKRRRRRKAAEPEEAEEEPEEKPKRRRRKKADDFDGPSATDLSKAITEAAEEFGADWVADLLTDEDDDGNPYSEDGTMKGVKPEMRQKIIDEINNELSD